LPIGIEGGGVRAWLGDHPLVERQALAVDHVDDSCAFLPDAGHVARR